MILDLIGGIFAPIFYGLGYLALRLIGARQPSERACTVASTALIVITIVCLVYILLRT